MLNIRRYQKGDWSAVWHIIKPVFRAGATYAFSPEISESEAHQAWIDTPQATYVAVVENDEPSILGTYYIKPNQPALGAHVCNCGYIVDAQARRQGIASQLCQHSQTEALKLGFQSMQYNLVVSTNEEAIRLWKKHDFQIIGTLTKAFKHKQLGFVDALVMYKQLH